MKKMKRLLALVLAGVLALAMFTACGTPDDTETATRVKVKLLDYMQDAMPRETKIGDDAEIQSVVADVVREEWKQGKYDVVVREAADGKSLIVITMMGHTFTRNDVERGVLDASRASLIEQFRYQDNTYYNRYGKHASAADIYTVARGEQVIVAFALRFAH